MARYETWRVADVADVAIGAASVDGVERIVPAVAVDARRVVADTRS
ncbi:hypothetical protein [Blastococcus sp. KM273129]|nr:hypothetical protein [Blastococcus sp. KM273129]